MLINMKCKHLLMARVFDFIQFFCFLLIVLVAEVATGVYAYLNQDQLTKLVRNSVKQSIQTEYGTNELQTQAFDSFQKHVSKTIDFFVFFFLFLEIFFL